MIDKSFGIHAQALQWRARRAELLATNVANADTPHYKARDVDFKTVFAQANPAGGTLDVTNEKHIQPAGYGGLPSGVLYRVPMQPSLDGNTVDIQVEQAEFARNAVNYQASLTFLNGKINGLLLAIKGQ